MRDRADAADKPRLGGEASTLASFTVLAVPIAAMRGVLGRCRSRRAPGSVRRRLTPRGYNGGGHADLQSIPPTPTYRATPSGRAAHSWTGIRSASADRPRSTPPKRRAGRRSGSLLTLQPNGHKTPARSVRRRMPFSICLAVLCGTAVSTRGLQPSTVDMSTASIRSFAMSSSPAMAPTYVDTNVPTLWPRRRATTPSGMPACNHVVAAACRQS